jgi:hypothetical protein
MSSSEGRITLANVPPGEYMAYAWDDWQQVEYSNADWMRRNASGVSITVQAGQTAQVKLRQQAAPPL